MATYSLSFQARFWAKVQKSEGCWLWTGGVSGSGYGAIRAAAPERAMLPTHRVSYEMHHGPIPEGLFVCHRCDIKLCVNPAHLFAGTCADNTRDAQAKGLLVAGDAHPSRIGREKRPRGTDIRQSRLAEDDVRAIRTAYATGGTSQAKLARSYGVSNHTVQAILEGKTWQHLL